MTMTRRAFIAGSTTVLSAPALCAQTDGIVRIEGPAFGARWRANLPDDADITAVVMAVLRIVNTVDAKMSPFHPHSEISVINRSQSLHELPASTDILTTLSEAKRIAGFTHGAFDPTLGGITGRYGFGPITSQPAGAFSDLVVTKSGVHKSDAGQSLDLCGIAKGFALDRIAAALTALGYQKYLVELGGEIIARGQHPQGRQWRAGIARPLIGQRSLQRSVAVTNDALATSGDQVNSYLYGDQRYGHIIDPQTHRPTDSLLASVSVFASRAMTADALATALYAMGPQEGASFARQNAVPALFMVRTGDGLQEIMTGDFASRLIG